MNGPLTDHPRKECLILRYKREHRLHFAADCFREQLPRRLREGLEPLRTANTPGVQDMYTRLLLPNLDFDSELQHVFWWEPDECRDSRVFHVDRVFLRLC